MSAVKEALWDLLTFVGIICGGIAVPLGLVVIIAWLHSLYISS